ncbi:MAG: hypothetical protein NC930_09185, partial [Candidatus Omnitrophica bacterium]|nr:hypothetical protein [Candidatus Omnitrophota bacterium]
MSPVEEIAKRAIGTDKLSSEVLSEDEVDTYIQWLREYRFMQDSLEKKLLPLLRDALKDKRPYADNLYYFAVAQNVVNGVSSLTSNTLIRRRDYRRELVMALSEEILLADKVLIFSNELMTQPDAKRKIQYNILNRLASFFGVNQLSNVLPLFNRALSDSLLRPRVIEAWHAVVGMHKIALGILQAGLDSKDPALGLKALQIWASMVYELIKMKMNISAGRRKDKLVDPQLQAVVDRIFDQMPELQGVLQTSETPAEMLKAILTSRKPAQKLKALKTWESISDELIKAKAIVSAAKRKGAEFNPQLEGRVATMVLQVQNGQNVLETIIRDGERDEIRRTAQRILKRIQDKLGPSSRSEVRMPEMEVWKVKIEGQLKQDDLEAFEGNFESFDDQKMLVILQALESLADETLTNIAAAKVIEPITYGKAGSILSIVTENIRQAGSLSPAVEKIYRSLKDKLNQIKEQSGEVEEWSPGWEILLGDLVFGTEEEQFQLIVKKLLSIDPVQRKYGLQFVREVTDADLFRKYIAQKGFIQRFFQFIRSHRFAPDVLELADVLGLFMTISDSLGEPTDEEILAHYEKALFGEDKRERQIAVAFFSAYSQPRLTYDPKFIQQLMKIAGDETEIDEVKINAGHALSNNSFGVDPASLAAFKIQPASTSPEIKTALLELLSKQMHIDAATREKVAQSTLFYLAGAAVDNIVPLKIKSQENAKPEDLVFEGSDISLYMSSAFAKLLDQIDPKTTHSLDDARRIILSVVKQMVFDRLESEDKGLRSEMRTIGPDDAALLLQNLDGLAQENVTASVVLTQEARQLEELLKSNRINQPAVLDWVWKELILQGLETEDIGIFGGGLTGFDARIVAEKFGSKIVGFLNREMPDWRTKALTELASTMGKEPDINYANAIFADVPGIIQNKHFRTARKLDQEFGKILHGLGSLEPHSAWAIKIIHMIYHQSVAEVIRQEIPDIPGGEIRAFFDQMKQDVTVEGQDLATYRKILEKFLEKLHGIVDEAI